ncbi:MAG: hypothetical protein IPI67_06415 [Myxococcales bacterium]|nr:hypothetical protein [Myxococcales bacterium]
MAPRLPPPIFVLLACGALACGRARAEDRPAPPGSAARLSPGAPAVAAPSPTSSVADAAPTPTPASAPPRLSDSELMPCAGLRATCDKAHPLVARGVLMRAEAYLANCSECRQRVQVTATRDRMRAIVARDERARHRGEPDDCRASNDTAVLVSPASLVAGDQPRVVVASDRALDARVEITAEGSRPLTVTERERGDGPPWYRVLGLGAVERGVHRVVVKQGANVIACQRFTVAERRRRRTAGAGVWKTERGWDRAAENLYSAWIAALFSAPEGKRWNGIGAVLTDASRNFLHGHLGLGEDADSEQLALHPDCADAPHVMRAYFAWKLGLPFGHHRCGYGQLDGPPRCGDWTTNETPPVETRDPGETMPATPRLASRASFRDFAERLLGVTTARSLRTVATDEVTDLYPVALHREHLRPGVVFADPYGHTLTLVKWVPQTAARPGQLLAVDAEPDGTIGMRRFWRGTFLFADQHTTEGFGFKAFRPIVRDKGEMRLLSNDELTIADGYRGFSLEPSRIDAADFYAQMSRMISPEPKPARQELQDLVGALLAQLERRVAEVDIAEQIVGARKTPIEMPEGRAMFRSTGPWEAVSTPCRDLRLLVGIDSVLSFPEQAARAEADATRGEALRRELEAVLRTESESKAIEYTRSDAGKQRLSLAEVIRRRAAFEAAYNPNDCPELRWGAAEGSAELRSCRRRAPDAQRGSMARMRHWFVKRYSCG